MHQIFLMINQQVTNAKHGGMNCAAKNIRFYLTGMKKEAYAMSAVSYDLRSPAFLWLQPEPL